MLSCITIQFCIMWIGFICFSVQIDNFLTLDLEAGSEREETPE